MTMTQNIGMEFSNIADTGLTVSRVGLGTWAIGGWMWGGTDDEESIATIRAAVERGDPPMDLAAPKRSSAARLPMVGCVHAW